MNYSAIRGDDFTLNLTVKDSDGDAKNIALYTILMTLKTDKSLADDAVAGVVEVDGVIDSGAGGLAHVTLPASVTEDLLGSYYYDIQLVDNTGLVETIQSGVITFDEDVTIRTS